jgi:uncharacterized repeat protein (TIGR04052 family)
MGMWSDAWRVACVVSVATACTQREPLSFASRTSQVARPETDAGDAAQARNDAGPAHPAHAAGATAPVAGVGGSAGGGAGASPNDAGRHNVTIRFKAKIFNQPFACRQTYHAVGAPESTVTPADLRFFVQDLRLIADDGRAVPVTYDERSPWQVASVALLDFEDQTGACSQGTAETNAEITGSVPHGHYDGVEFSNGVPEALNHEDPLKHPAPLQVTDLTWGWLTGFKFFVAELRQAADPDDDASLGGSGLGMLHVGAAACNGTPGGTLCQHANRNDIRLPHFDPERDSIVVDVGALFSKTDLAQSIQCHSDIEACEPLFANVGVDWKTGRTTDTQTVYRVE